jgi:hypothetical protein
MAIKGNSDRRSVVKRTSQGGTSPKTSTMSKTQKKAYKSYRGQGR